MKFIISSYFLLMFSVVGICQTSDFTVQNGVWTDDNVWNSGSAPDDDYTGTLGDTLFIHHTVRIAGDGNKMDITGPLVLVISETGILTDSSQELGYSTPYVDVEFKTKNDANPVVIINNGYLEVGRKFQVEYDDTLYNHDYLKVGMGSGNDADFHIDGYICNTDTIEVDPNGKMKIHGGRLDCGGIIQVCNIEYDDRFAGAYSSLININIDTCNSNDDYSCPSTSYGPKAAQDSVVIPDSSNISFCDGGFWPLPITLESFNGQYEPGTRSVVLNWSTLSEINNDYFTILRSDDVKSWENIGELSGNGNSNERIKYTFTDEEPTKGVQYYKLRQTDFNGEYSDSKIIAIDCEENTNHRIFPNPANEEITMPLLPNYTRYKILGCEGELMNESSIKLGQTNIDVSFLGSGLYFLIVSNSSESHTIKFAKLAK